MRLARPSRSMTAAWSRGGTALRSSSAAALIVVVTNGPTSLVTSPTRREDGRVTATDVPVFDRQLGASDAVLWDIEKDPVLRSTITAVALLDRSPDWDRLVRRVAHGADLVPR